MTRFSSTLRTRAEIVRLASAQAPDVWTLRVQGAEVWDAVRVEVVPETRVREVKYAAMKALMPDVDDIDGYVVKFNGAELRDELASVHMVAAMDGSTFLLVSRRRRPVR